LLSDLLEYPSAGRSVFMKPSLRIRCCLALLHISLPAWPICSAPAAQTADTELLTCEARDEFARTARRDASG
jgi:hypothetical protein